ncbi:protein SRC2 [Cynara cardunculus var. scolymus]|uniref:C2 calcium-dependent membrane targeting n=1 Tax=Cynara cardunculus var. scolymus TaxID=59895 RepID=A0A118K6Z4_CYNCS|nr:protein SRC2 [Cynara cardunculus var. scolymus]KVI11431.1 C2 calcium-dependent membrane targeting [Cynara cardunculus var. scolymus]
MAARYELEVTVSSAKNLKNVNWRHGPLKPYAIVWVDPKNKCSTPVDEEGDESPVWDQKLVIALNDPIEESTLYIDIVHANAAEDTKPLIGSAKLRLKDVVDEVGIGECFADGLKLKRPSGRPQGKVEVKVYIREPRYRAPDPYYAPPYGVPPPQHPAPPPYPYAAPAPYGGNYPYSAPPSGYPYSPYAAPPPPQYGQTYVQPAYGGQPAYSGQPSYGGYREEKKSKYGMGTGLAVGAAAGLLGGLAIAEGIDHVEDEIAEDAADKVEEDLGYDVDDD